MKDDILRKVAHEVDMFEMEHYNEEKKGMFEITQKFLDEINDETVDLETKKHIDPEHIGRQIQESLMEANTHIDCMESIGVQNGLVRSKHLHNLLLAANIRDTQNTYNYDNPDIDYVEQKVPWYKVDNLIEKLYLKYHETKIHRCFDIMQRYLIDDESDSRGIYGFWKEIDELWEEVFDEETLSNHYHNNDDYWEYDIDPKECKNLLDFFQKRIAAKIEDRKEAEKLVVEQSKIDKKKQEELKILKAKKHKLRNYIPLKKYGEEVPGSVYWFKDINKKFQKNEYGILYVGESRNFHKRFSAYKPKDNGRLTELETKLQKKFPKIKKETIQKFVRDPEQCRIRVIPYKFLSNNFKRKMFESRIIQRVKPLLNRNVI